VEWHLIVGDAENVKCKLTHNPDGNTYSVTSSFARTTRKGVENNPADFHTLLATSLPLFQAPLVSERSRKIARVCNDDVAFSWWQVTYFLVV